MARWLSTRGAIVRVADSRDAPPFALRLRGELPAVELHTGAFRFESLDDIDLMAVSPGVALAEPVIQRAVERGVEVVGDIELFARIRSEFPGSRVIAITGSNGKKYGNRNGGRDGARRKEKNTCRWEYRLTDLGRRVGSRSR